MHESTCVSMGSIHQLHATPPQAGSLVSSHELPAGGALHELTCVSGGPLHQPVHDDALCLGRRHAPPSLRRCRPAAHRNELHMQMERVVASAVSYALCLRRRRTSPSLRRWCRLAAHCMSLHVSQTDRCTSFYMTMPSACAGGAHRLPRGGGAGPRGQGGKPG